MSHTLTIKAFDALSLHELYEVMWLRSEVFVVGQKITAEPEVDGRDPECEHALLRESPDGRLIGTARIFYRARPLVVGRVAIHPDVQRAGLGTVLMEGVQRHLAGRPAELHAQAHLEAWYTRLGWAREGDVFMEAEIPHVTMRL